MGEGAGSGVRTQRQNANCFQPAAGGNIKRETQAVEKRHALISLAFSSALASDGDLVISPGGHPIKKNEGR